MKWKIDTTMKDGQIARAYDDNGQWCVMHTIEGKGQYLVTSLGPVAVEYTTGRREVLLPSFAPKVHKSFFRPYKILYLVILFIGVFFFTIVAYKLWVNLF